MPDERLLRPSGHARRWDDTPGIVEYRVLQLERDRDDHDARIRNLELAMSTLTDLKDVVDQIQTDQRSAAAAAWRNFWQTAIGVLIVVLTVLGSHYFK
jgi:hypothetical protein